MKLEISKNANDGYLAKVVKLNNIRKHEGADRLQITTIDGNNIITDLSTKIGDVVVFFPAETTIQHEFLAMHNQYRKDLGLNIDKDSKGGFFEANRRVKAVNLRGERSSGIMFNIDLFTKETDISKYIDVEFNTIDGKLFCEKYIPKFVKTPGSGNKINKAQNRIKRISKLLEDQFRFHIDTVQFGKNIFKFQLDDIVSVTSKIHGTSAVFANVLCVRPLKFKERIFNILGANIKPFEYDLLYTSRKVVKNQYYNPQNNAGFYGEDVWEIHAKKLKPFIDKGITLYGEIVGYVNASGKMVQKDFDYGCEFGTSEFYLYRVTYTNPDGKVFEFSARQVQEYGKSYGIKVVPEIFYGKFRDFLTSELVERKLKLDNDPNMYELGEFGPQYTESYKDRKSIWENDVLTYIRNTYLEGDDPMCKNIVPFEGLVFRREILDIDSYKFKSLKFLAKESTDLDNGIIDMETEESSNE